MQVSVGGNDIALAPAPCTVLHMLLGICCTPTAGIEKVRAAVAKCVVKASAARVLLLLRRCFGYLRRYLRLALR